jgi:hypothetical protein
VTLTEFLLARIAEDEIVAKMRQERASRFPTRPTPMEESYGHSHFVADPSSASRILAECTAKRHIVERAVAESDEWPLVVLATLYADHPDYLDEWRP